MMDRETYKRNEAVFAETEYIAGRIYIDIRFLKYIQLGQLLASKMMTQDIYTQIREIIIRDEFKLRHTNDILSICRDIPTLGKLLSDSDNPNISLIRAPEFAGSIEIIQNLIRYIDDRQQVFGGSSVEPVSITIDTAGIGAIDKATIHLLTNEYARWFNQSVTILTDELINRRDDFDIFIMDDLSWFNELYIDDLNAGLMLNKRIICYRGIPDLPEMQHMSMDQRKSIIDGLEVLMSTASEFTFIDMPLCAT